MKKLAGLLALAVMLSFGTATVSFAGDPAPAPAPTDKKGKDTKKPKFFGSGEKKDEKKDTKGGK